jgi:tripartite-type tricarboxylate transporter receptor subunit TctC
MFGTDTIVTVNPHVYKSLGFRVEDLRPVMIATQFSQTLVCNPALGVKTVAELVARARSDKLSYASGGAGVPGHLSMELLMHMAGFSMAHVPYKGPAPATLDVVANQVPCGLLAGPTVLPHIRAGRLVPLAVSGKSRSPTLPEVPTMSEAGVPGYEADFALFLQAPRATPDDIVTRMREALLQSLNIPEIKSRLAASDQVLVGSSPEQAAAVAASDSRKWGDVARRIKLGLD